MEGKEKKIFKYVAQTTFNALLDIILDVTDSNFLLLLLLTPGKLMIHAIYFFHFFEN